MIGSSLGPYKILEKLGAGGMGEVFLAEDTRLNRKVAIKVLPPEFASDRERLARFEQEAKAAAALNHPHIAVVHDIGFEEGAGADEAKTDPNMAVSAIPAVGLHYMVQEYLEGGTLRDPLKKGALPLNKALLFSREVAEGLAAAHEAGIIHRDLKPDNIFITKDGHAKILDFGLAKLTELAGPGGTELSMSPTVLGTVAGQVMGTAGYMAPEQIEGEDEIDARADLFAFGCLLYEMIGGKRAFGGDSVLDTLHAIARSEPQPVGEINPELPADLERIVKKCLAKDREQRYQNATDVLVDLRNLSSEVEAGTVRTVADRAAGATVASAGAAGLSWKFALPALGAVAIAAAAATWMLTPVPPTDERVFRYELTLPENVTYTALAVASIAISPQGTHVATAAEGQIYVRAVGDDEAAPVRGTEGIALVPFFSPDGQSLGFWAEGELRKVSIGGGAAVKLTDLPDDAPAGASWSADNTILYAADGIFRVSGDGGEPQEVVTGKEDSFYQGPRLLPDGSILYTVSTTSDATWDDARIVVQGPDDTEPTVLVSGGRDARYLPTGHIIYALEDAVLARTFDLETREVGGAVPLLQGVAGASVATGAAHFDVSTTGDLVFIAGGSQGQEARTLVWRDAGGGKEVVAQANEPGRTWTPRLSPDGRYVAYRTTGSDGDNIWLLDLQRGIHSLFTPDGGARSFAWSPGGEWLYYSADSNTENGTNVYRRPADMRSDAEEFLAGPGNEFVRSISADGEWLLFADTDVINTGGYDIKVLSLTEPGDAEAVFDREVQEVTATFAPNGKWVAYVSGPQNDRRVFVQGFPNLGGVTQVSDGVGDEPLWAPDSSRLFYRSNTDIMVVDVVSEEPFDVSAPRPFLENVLFVGDTQNAGSYDISLDGERLLMVDWGDGEAGDAGRFRVVLNWLKELNERVPTGR